MWMFRTGTSPQWFWSCCTVLSVQASLLLLYPSIFSFSERETGPQSAVRVCIDISCLPQDMRSVLRLHTHLSMLTPSRTDIFPFFLPLSPLNPSSGFPPPCSHSLSLLLFLSLLHFHSRSSFGLVQTNPQSYFVPETMIISYYEGNQNDINVCHVVLILSLTWPCVWPACLPPMMVTFTLGAGTVVYTWGASKTFSF